MTSILIVDDDEDVRDELASMVARAGHAVCCAGDVAAARAHLATGDVGVVLLDLGLPGEEGLSALERIGPDACGAQVLVITGRDEASLAVRAMRAGAADYLVKPWDRATLLRAVDAASAQDAARRDLASIRSARAAGPDAIGSSPAWRAITSQAQVAACNGRIPVLLTGECGTGKDVMAHQIHRWSPRAEAPFVTVNAACLPASILESELFGHEAGAFTDARAARRGLFEQAHGGTLFLDEIGELPIALQPKLLRVLEGHAFRRLGGEREVRVDVRLVAATNRSLPDMITCGTFREDLYYRLRVIELAMPPLRERPGDARALALHMIAQLASELGAPRTQIDALALARLSAYPWPGNVRELKNAIERAVVLARGATIELAHLPPEVVDAPRNARPADAAPRSGVDGLSLSLESAVRTHVLRVYETTAHNMTRTAALLGITRVSLRRKLREYGVYPVSA